MEPVFAQTIVFSPFDDLIADAANSHQQVNALIHSDRDEFQ
jgi:hypothetical protein